MFAPHFPLLQLPSFCHHSLLPLLHGRLSAPVPVSVPKSSFRRANGDRHLLSPSSSSSYRNSSQNVKVRSQLRHPIIAADDYWGTWTALSEKTKIGSTVSAALVSTLVGLAASNFGIIPYEAMPYSIVMEFLLPLSVPLLLFRADIRHILRTTGTLLGVFLLGSVATIIGTVVAFLMVPMRSLGPDNWKIAAALMGSYIGGCKLSEKALGVSPSVLAAGVAADNVITALYFVALFALASRTPPEPLTSTDDASTDKDFDHGTKLPVLQTATAVVTSFAICKFVTWITNMCKIQGANLPGITAVVVILATILPKQFNYLAPAADTIALILMQVFFAVVGASGSVWYVINNTPSIFMFALVQVTVHLAIILCFGKLFRIDLKLLLLASNANIGGPTTACGMATAKGWRSLVVPSILAGIFGIAIATFLGVMEKCISKMASTDERIKPFLVTGEEKDKDRIQPRETPRQALDLYLCKFKRYDLAVL
uniref:Uncharacterized protein n=1 Tax=Cucumis melo subsp. melo TaxID=412675 RepID=E5GBC8_CUCME|nr:hypothetical protein [Cucumis melo subsp. melo]